MLSVVLYESKNIILYEKNVKLTKNNTFINIICNGIRPHYRFLPNFSKMIGFS